MAEVIRNNMLVRYEPNPVTTNELIQTMNAALDGAPGRKQEVATEMASQVAAIAFMMLETNSMATVQEVFNGLIANASRHRRHYDGKVAEARKLAGQQH